MLIQSGSKSNEVCNKSPRINKISKIHRKFGNYFLKFSVWFTNLLIKSTRTPIFFILYILLDAKRNVQKNHLLN